MTLERITVECPESPNFVGCWKMADTALCDGVVDLFESNANSHNPGAMGDGNVNETQKSSTDMTVRPLDLEDEKFAALLPYMEHLKECYLDYMEQWDFLKTFMNRVHIGTFNIQRYNEGGHFSKLHSERTSLKYLHRMLVWMTYLNDVEEGGETEFPSFGLKVRPEKGKTIIWPSDWTHAHFGGVVTKGSKYIITGWMHYPDDA